MVVWGGWVMVSSPAGSDWGMVSWEVELAAWLDVAVVDIFEEGLAH